MKLQAHRVPDLREPGATRPELIGEWSNMLGHQLPSLPPVDLFWNALPEFAVLCINRHRRGLYSAILSTYYG